MTPDDLMRFIGRFGDPEDHTQTRFTLPGYPKIFILSNRVVEGKPIGAERLAALGVVNRLVKPQTALDAALAWADDLARVSPNLMLSAS